MARLVKVTLMMEMVALLAAAISSSDVTKYYTTNSWENITLPRSAPALTLIRFSAESDILNTLVGFEIHFLVDKQNISEQFTFSRNDNKKNIIAVFYLIEKSDNNIGVMNILKNQSWSLYHSISHIRVCTNQTVTWEVAYNNFEFLTKTAAASSTPAVNTALPSTQPSIYLNPAFLALAALCAILAIATLVLSVLQIHRCASSRSGLQGIASSTDDTTFRSTETPTKQVPYPLNHGCGALHVSENSLYGVL